MQDTSRFAALRQQHYNATVIDLRRAREGLLVLRLRPDAPIPEYAAGQWLPAGIGLWEPRGAGCPEETLAEATSLARRTYSLSCSILARGEDRLFEREEHDWYELFMGFDPERATGMSGAAVAARFAALEPGDRVWVGERPQGNYTLDAVQPDDDVLFLATGTGEAPHNRMIWELLRRRHRGRIASIVTVRVAADLAYRELHARLMRMFPAYRWAGVATREQEHRGVRLQAMLASGNLERHAGWALDPERSHVFLCGNAGMLGRPQHEGSRKIYPASVGMIELLEERGFRSDPHPDSHVHFEHG